MREVILSWPGANLRRCRDKVSPSGMRVVRLCPTAWSVLKAWFWPYHNRVRAELRDRNVTTEVGRCYPEARLSILIELLLDTVYRQHTMQALLTTRRITSRFQPLRAPHWIRMYASDSTPTYEHILVSTPKPGVGFSKSPPLPSLHTPILTNNPPSPTPPPQSPKRPLFASNRRTQHRPAKLPSRPHHIIHSANRLPQSLRRRR
jgi:hypothetical protein